MPPVLLPLQNHEIVISTLHQILRDAVVTQQGPAPEAGATAAQQVQQQRPGPQATAQDLLNGIAAGGSFTSACC